MKKVKQTFRINFFSAALFAMFTMLLSSSCRKNMSQSPDNTNTELSAAAHSSLNKSQAGLATAPFETTLFVPCSNGGEGESVTVTGTLSIVYQIAWNDNGFHLVYHAQSHGLTATGLTSGETFKGSDGTQGTVSASWVNEKWTGTTIEEMKIVGQNTKYTLRYKQHLVVTPDGRVTVSVRETTAECKM